MKKIILILLILVDCIFIYSQVSNDSLIHNQSKEEERVIMPKFPGGLDNLVSFLSSNIKFPKDAIKAKITGRVLLKFTLSTEGKVKDIVVIESLYPSCDAEAIRVVGLMPNWTPAEYKGRKVEIIQKIPILFKQ